MIAEDIIHIFRPSFIKLYCRVKIIRAREFLKIGEFHECLKLTWTIYNHHQVELGIRLNNSLVNKDSMQEKLKKWAKYFTLNLYNMTTAYMELNEIEMASDAIRLMVAVSNWFLSKRSNFSMKVEAFSNNFFLRFNFAMKEKREFDSNMNLILNDVFRAFEYVEFFKVPTALQLPHGYIPEKAPTQRKLIMKKEDLASFVTPQLAPGVKSKMDKISNIELKRVVPSESTASELKTTRVTGSNISSFLIRPSPSISKRISFSSRPDQRFKRRVNPNIACRAKKLEDIIKAKNFDQDYLNAKLRDRVKMQKDEGYAKNSHKILNITKRGESYSLCSQSISLHLKRGGFQGFFASSVLKNLTDSKNPKFHVKSFEQYYWI